MLPEGAARRPAAAPFRRPRRPRWRGSARRSGWGHREQLVVERHDLSPVRRRVGVHGVDGRQDLVRTGPAPAQAATDDVGPSSMRSRPSGSGPGPRARPGCRPERPGRPARSASSISASRPSTSGSSGMSAARILVNRIASAHRSVADELVRRARRPVGALVEHQEQRRENTARQAARQARRPAAPGRGSRALIFCLDRVSRLAIAASSTRNAPAISATLRPPRSRRVRATWALVARAGWQQVNISRSRSSTTDEMGSPGSSLLSLSWRPVPVGSRGSTHAGSGRSPGCRPSWSARPPGSGAGRTPASAAGRSGTPPGPPPRRRRCHRGGGSGWRRPDRAPHGRHGRGRHVPVGGTGFRHGSIRRPARAGRAGPRRDPGRPPIPFAASSSAASRSGTSTIQKPPRCSLDSRRARR